MSLFVYFLLAYGISFAFVQSMGPFNIFQHIRDWMQKIHPTLGDLFDCMFCFPTWVGLVLSLINVFLLPTIPFTPFMVVFDMPILYTLIGDMFVTASGVYIINTLVEAFEVNNDDDN